MSALETRIPPPLVCLAVAAIMAALAWATVPLDIDRPVRLAVAATLALIGLACAMSGFRAFSRAKTTVNPTKPEDASALVISGIYRITRNPMYVGLTAVLLGWAVWLAAPWALLGPLAFVLYINWFQIIPEERVLAAKFGQSYADYRKAVRRWL